MKARIKNIERTTVWFTLLGTVGIVAVHLFSSIACRYLSGTPCPTDWITRGTLIAAAIISVRTSSVMPAWLDGSAKRYPIRAGLFALLAVLSMVQTTRITANRLNPENRMVILTGNEFWTAHECGTAYFHACELNDHGEENLYHAGHYPALNRDLEAQTQFEGMEVGDAYQYPPQFLLLPKTILLFTDHYPTIRYVWFALQFLGIAAVFLLLAHWVGGTAGRWMAMLAPLVILSPAALYVYQYTQFHFAAIVMAVAGMLAFEKNKNALGGALLAFAIIGKIFPGFLVILLLAERRWKPLAWTAGFGVAYTVAALAVLGLAPFSAFFSYHLPRLQSFSAFAFLDIWPEYRLELITANLSPYGQIMRLGEMGLRGMTDSVASASNSLFMIALIMGIVFAGRRMMTKERRAQIWLGILGLASMGSPAAWGDYITLPALWILTIVTVEAVKNRRVAIATGTCWIFFYFLLGAVPLGSFPAPMITYALASISFILLVVLQGWAVVRKEKVIETENIELIASEVIA
jgi:hypothetical protein